MHEAVIKHEWKLLPKKDYPLLMHLSCLYFDWRSSGIMLTCLIIMDKDYYKVLHFFIRQNYVYDTRI